MASMVDMAARAPRRAARAHGLMTITMTEVTGRVTVSNPRPIAATPGPTQRVATKRASTATVESGGAQARCTSRAADSARPASIRAPAPPMRAADRATARSTRQSAAAIMARTLADILPTAASPSALSLTAWAMGRATLCARAAISPALATVAAQRGVRIQVHTRRTTRPNMMKGCTSTVSTNLTRARPAVPTATSTHAAERAARRSAGARSRPSIPRATARMTRTSVIFSSRWPPNVPTPGRALPSAAPQGRAPGPPRRR